MNEAALSVSEMEVAASLRMSEALSMVRMNEALTTSSLNDALAAARMNEVLSSAVNRGNNINDNFAAASRLNDVMTSSAGGLNAASRMMGGESQHVNRMYEQTNLQQHSSHHHLATGLSLLPNLRTDDELITPSRIEDSLFLNTPLRANNRIEVSSSGSSLQEVTRTQEDLAASSLVEDVSSPASRLDHVLSTSSLDQEDLPSKIEQLIGSNNTVPTHHSNLHSMGDENRFVDEPMADVPQPDYNRISNPLSVASWKQQSNESYHQFYTRILGYQMDSLLKAGTHFSGGGILDCDDVMTKSHQMLVCVIWLERIDHRLPALVQVKYAREFQAGANLVDLVPLLAESIDDLMDNIDNSPVKQSQYNTNSSDLRIKQEAKPLIKKEAVYDDLDDSFDQSDMSYYEVPRNNDEQIKDNNMLEDIIKLEMPNEDQEERMENEDDYVDDPGLRDDLPVVDNIKGNFEVCDEGGELKKKFRIKKKKKRRGRPGRRALDDEEREERRLLLKKPLMPLDHDITCEKCDYSTRFVKEFRVHQKEGHNISVRYCKKCDIFVQLVNFKKHLADAHRSEPSICPECSKAFRTDQGLLGHRLKVHNIGEGFMCEFCPYKTVKMSHLQNHMKNHSDCPKPYVCNECGASFSRKDSLQNHVKYRHEGVIYYCDQCNFSTPRGIKSFKLHMNKEHLGLIFAKCDKCGQKFKSRYQLRTHMATIHGSGKYFSCTKCEYNATTKQLLQEHDMKVHEMIFFRCELCPSKFVRKYALRRHMENVHKLAGVKVEGQNNI